MYIYVGRPALLPPTNLHRVGAIPAPPPVECGAVVVPIHWGAHRQSAIRASGARLPARICGCGPGRSHRGSSWCGLLLGLLSCFHFYGMCDRFMVDGECCRNGCWNLVLCPHMAKGGMPTDGCANIHGICTSVYGIYPAIHVLRWNYYRYEIDTI